MNILRCYCDCVHTKSFSADGKTFSSGVFWTLKCCKASVVHHQGCAHILKFSSCFTFVAAFLYSNVVFVSRKSAEFCFTVEMHLRLNTTMGCRETLFSSLEIYWKCRASEVFFCSMSVFIHDTSSWGDGFGFIHSFYIYKHTAHQRKKCRYLIIHNVI